MLTVEFDEKDKRPKYEQLYRHIRDDIASGKMSEGAKLPSKRKLAAHLHISLNTIENAYAQLTAEGFVEPVEKKGYFVLPVVSARRSPPPAAPSFATPAKTPGRKTSRLTLRNNAVDTESFPFASWSRLMRDSLREDHAELVREQHPQGDRQLREAIAGYLLEYRNMNVAADRIVIGAGTSYLLGMLTELVPGRSFAIEDPGYFMLARTLQSRGVPFAAVPVDSEGMAVEGLRRSRAAVSVITPSNQFPLCRVMSVKRRMQLLDWAHEANGRYLVEDDYDSDYRYALKPAPALHGMDWGERVVYFNTFARTLTPSLRIAYMVLPHPLIEAYGKRRQLYSCTVSGFEQRTLWRFIRDGHYERHLNRMRTIYKRRRNALLEGLAPLSGKVGVSGIEAGLHLLLHSEAGMTEAEMTARAAARDVVVFGLSGFFHQAAPETNTVIAGYGGLSEAELRKAAARLCKAWK